MTPTQGEHAQTALAHELFAAAQLAPGEGIEDAVSRIAAALTAPPAQPAAPQGVAYAELPMQFACSGVFPVYSADQMRAFADGTHALRTKSEASREFLERMLSAMEGVIDVADRQTDEFEALRSCVVDLTLMLFKPEALRASNGQAPACKGSSGECTFNGACMYACGAAPAAGAVAGPGWKLVPVVVTNEMWQAYKRPSGKSGDWSFAQRYTAMIAAAPTPAAQADSQPAMDRDSIREIFMAHGFPVKEGQTDLKQYVYDAADALLRAAHAPADSVLADAADPLQGAANWLAEAHGQFSPVVLSGCLMIGYNRAKRLHDAALAARKQGAKHD